MSTAAVRANLSRSTGELWRSLQPPNFVFVTAWLLAAALFLARPSWLPARSLGSLTLYAVAAVGLNLVMGIGNMPSIGHGAFMALGALVATLVRTHTSLGFGTSVVVATVAAAIGSFVVGRGAIHLRAVYLALSSWLGAWLVAVTLAAFPGLSGGSSGIVVPEATLGGAVGIDWRLTPTAFLVLGWVLLGSALIVHRCLARSSAGLLLATIKQNPREAAAIGSLRDDVRLKLFVFGSTLGGVAGAVAVHLAGIFDHSSFGVLLSVSLFLAVMLGGPGRVFGPLVGAVVVAFLPIGGQPLIPFVTWSDRGGELVAGVLLLTALALGRRDGFEPPSPRRSEEPGERIAPGLTPARLVVRGVTKSFGGLVALEDVDLEVRGGEVHGVMGPNGSGKSTLLSLISGHRFPDSGAVTLDDDDVTHLPALARVRLGVSRSLQSTELFPGLTATQHFEAATLADRRYGGFARAVLRTPLARAEEARARRRAAALLDDFGVAGYADTVAERIPVGARRLLMIGAAVIDRRVVLLDEPSAGMSAAEVLRAAGVILELKRRGVAVVVVEHNMKLLRRVADVVTVLDAGRVIASGPPGVVYEDARVREAYLGSDRGGTA